MVKEKNIFEKLFSRKKTPSGTNRAEILSGGTVFTPFSGNAYANDIYREAVDAIARNTAKITGAHIIKTAEGRINGDTRLNRLLQVRPNPYMSAFDMIYRLVTHYFLYNNAFAYLHKDDKGEVTAIFPIKAANVEFLSDPQDNLYCKFLFNNGNSYILPYSDIIHLRRNYNDSDLFGDPNTAVNPALQLAHTQNEASVAALKNGAYIRGILKIPTMLRDEDRKKVKDRFIADYMSIDNNGGILATDMHAEYEPIDNKPFLIDDKQHQAVKNKIYAYLGISEKIVMSLYSRTEFSAFYESVIEPFAIQLSLEFTDKIFTPREQSFGNSVLFRYDFFEFASTENKIALIKDIVPLGLISVNQALNILEMPSVPDGDKRVVSLNYVNAAKADKYQLGSEEE